MALGPAPVALLVGVALGRERRDDASLDELAALAVSAGLAVGARAVCHRARPDPGLYVGQGKAGELAAAAADCGAELVLFDHEISAVQQRNLERLWNLRVVDRTDLILDIFAQRARSAEGKMQVELARLERQSSRLVRAWSHLERQRGGIGVRGGPGETQLEMDRRMIAARIRQVRERLARSGRQRLTRRRARGRRSVFTVSLVGYTNAGKSTLFNALTGAGTYAADQLFATLDTLSRRLHLAPGVELVLSDTVGFVRDLPHTLVAAFRATLEETADADLLLHVVDASAPDRDMQIEQVERVLAEIGARDAAHWQVWNKIDSAGLAPGVHPGGCGSIDRFFLSARTGEGLGLLRQALENAVRARARPGADAPAEPADAGVAPAPDVGTGEVPFLRNGLPDVDPNSRTAVAQ